MHSDREIAETIMQLVHLRGAGKTICPSEVARTLEPEDELWRGLMERVRDTAALLAAHGYLNVTQKGVAVDAITARGPIRLGLPKNAKKLATTPFRQG